MISHTSTPSAESSTSSTSITSLSPSNSASQLGSRNVSSKGRKTAKGKGDAGGGKLTASSLARLKDLEKNDGLKMGTKMAGLIDVPLSWRPYYLQRKILSAFFAIFAACIIVSEALLDYSGRNAGLLGETNSSLRYLWAIVPTAVLTVIAALWSRVEYQAKMSAPWLRLAMGPDLAEKTLLLDYLSMVPPRDAIAAFKNGDVAVGCATVIAILLKIVIIVSTGMISLTVLDSMEQTAPITLTTQFVNNGSHLANVGTFPLLTMLGLERDNLTFPDGLFNQFALQEFTSDMSSTTQFLATVDGFAGSLNCEAAQLTVNSVQNTRAGVQFNTTVSTSDCTANVPILSQSFNGTTASNRTHFFARFGHASCGSSADNAAQRIVVIYGTGSIDTKPTTSASNQAINGSIPESQQIICTPQYSISQVDVVKNGTFMDSVMLDSSPQPRQLSNVQPWDIAQAFFNSFTGAVAASISDVNSPYFSVPVNVDAPMYLAFGLQAQEDAINGTFPASSTSFLDLDTLQNLANSYFQQYSALIAHQALVQPASIPASCTAYIGGDRLVVGTVAVQIVAVLLAVILLLNMVAVCTVPGKGFLPRDPHSLLDVAALLSHSRPLLQTLRGAGGADEATLRNRLRYTSFYSGVTAYDRGSAETGQGYFRVFPGVELPETAPDFVEPSSNWHHPFGLHPIQRVLMYLVLAGLIAGLEITLRISNSGGGFATIGAGAYKHFLWTMIPALVVSLIAWYFIVTDFRVRALAPFAELARPNGGTFSSMTFSLLDRTALMAVYKSARAKNFVVASAAAAVSIAALLPVFVATLFSAMTIPQSSQVQLVTQDFFSNSTALPANSSACATCLDGMTLASLVLDGNLSYPAFTYEDLAFPTLSIIPIIGDNENDDLETTATVPAVRSLMTCRYYAQHDITVNLTTNYHIGSIVNPLRINLPGEPSLGNTELLQSTLVIGTAQPLTNGTNQTTVSATTAVASPAIASNAFFGQGAYRPLQAVDNSTIPHWVYAWGQLSNANTNQTTVQTISALACNESMQQVQVAATFSGALLDINPDKPPAPIESSAQPSDAALSTSLNYAGLVNLSTPHILDGFFGSLVLSRYAIPVSELGDPSAASINSGPGTQNNPVANAIVAQHGILRAQVVSTAGRRPTTASSQPAAVFPLAANSTTPIGNAAERSFTGHLTSVSNGVRRLLQDAPTTRVLQALLGAILLFSLISWVTFPGSPNVLPRPPTSIASVAALLADGNVFGFFGRGPEWQTADELQSNFRDGLHVTAGFTLGWARARRRRREETLAVWGMHGASGFEGKEELFGINASRTGGWGGGENVGLGLQARVGYAQRGYVGNWGWRT